MKILVPQYPYSQPTPTNCIALWKLILVVFLGNAFPKTGKRADQKVLEARTFLRLWCLLHLGARGWSCLPQVARGSASVRASWGGYLALKLVQVRLSPFWFLFPCSLEKLSLCTAPTGEGVMEDVLTAREGRSPPANRKCLAASDPSFWLFPLATSV